MSRRRLSVVVACLSAFANLGAQAPTHRREPPPGREFVVSLSPVPATGSCASWWQLAGQWGITGDIAVRWISPGQFAIPSEFDKKPGKALQISTWCRGYGMSLIDVKDLEKSTFSKSVMLAPLGEKEISGRVLSAPDGTSLLGATVTVTYRAPWVCSFFERGDCGPRTWTVAKAQIGADGMVQFRVPDFLGDPAIKDRPMREPFGIGGFSLRAELRRRIYELKPADPEQLRVRDAYPAMVLQPGPPR